MKCVEHNWEYTNEPNVVPNRRICTICHKKQFGMLRDRMRWYNTPMDKQDIRNKKLNDLL